MDHDQALTDGAPQRQAGADVSSHLANRHCDNTALLRTAYAHVYDEGRISPEVMIVMSDQSLRQLMPPRWRHAVEVMYDDAARAAQPQAALDPTESRPVTVLPPSPSVAAIGQQQSPASPAVVTEPACQWPSRQNVVPSPTSEEPAAVLTWTAGHTTADDSLAFQSLPTMPEDMLTVQQAVAEAAQAYAREAESARLAAEKAAAAAAQANELAQAFAQHEAHKREAEGAYRRREAEVMAALAHEREQLAAQTQQRRAALLSSVTEQIPWLADRVAAAVAGDGGEQR